MFKSESWRETAYSWGFAEMSLMKGLFRVVQVGLKEPISDGEVEIMKGGELLSPIRIRGKGKTMLLKPSKNCSSARAAAY